MSMAAAVGTDEPAAPTTRDRLIEAAIEVFWERGYERAGVQEIARRAGLTTGAIYGNFRNKAELLFAAVDARGAEELDELFAARLRAETAGELLAELGSHLLDRADHGADDRGDDRAGLLLDAFVAARRDPDVAGHVLDLIGQRGHAIGAIVERARREGDVADDVSTDAVVALALVLALGSLLFGELGLPVPRGGEWSTLVRRVVSALGPTSIAQPLEEA